MEKQFIYNSSNLPLVRYTHNNSQKMPEPTSDGKIILFMRIIYMARYFGNVFLGLLIRHLIIITISDITPGPTDSNINITVTSL